ncbi:MAG TPA: DHH family phosphoesterase [Gemmatimonadales bacterium]|nr:DHH family phosphoesterase [Gemmatimonadales bacterium]
MPPISLSPEKLAAGKAFIDGLKLTPGMRVCLTTHVNPDGDGLGSEVGLALLLRALGANVVITNPTPTPSRYGFLFDGLPGLDKTKEAVKELRRADLIIVLDIADLGRLGMLAETVKERGVTVACVDHHVSKGDLPPGPRYVDAEAAATGELIRELARANGWELTPEAARALYVAIVTDTGGFRFSNTKARTLRAAADLLECGIDPEAVYVELYSKAPEGRVRLMAEALQTLVVEHDVGMAWVTIPPGSLERHGVDPDDLDGVVEYARSIDGVRLGLLFREIAGGRIKVSFRSIGGVDVAKLAAQFGGGGHAKAAGASLPGALADVQATVLKAARAYLAG